MGYTCSLNRVEIRADLTAAEAEEIKRDEKIKYIQIGAALPPETLKRINHVILSAREDVMFRVYGFRGQVCDLTFLELLDNVCDLSVGEMDAVSNLVSMGKLPRLKKLRVSLGQLNDLSFLEKVTTGLTGLMLGTGIANSKLELDVIGRFKDLESLFVYKINRGFEVIRHLGGLRDLTVNAAKRKDFAFLQDTGVERLSLGMIKDFDSTSLYGNTTIKRLELWKISQLEDADILLHLPGLVHARFYQMSRMVRIPDLSACAGLKTLIFDEVKNLEDLSGLETLPGIEQIELYGAKAADPAVVERILKNPPLKKMICQTGSVKKDRQIAEIIKAYGKA